MKNTMYITTSIPYVNAYPHIGHALEFVQGDTLARYYRLRDRAVIFQTGTDDNAGKNLVAARNAGIPVHEFVDRNASRFADLLDVLDVVPDRFVRTSDCRHRDGVVRIWSRIDTSLFYRKTYHGLYCEGCEAFLTEGDLDNGKCPEHAVEPAMVEEQNIFFRLSRFQDDLERIISNDIIRIEPDTRRREVLSFIRGGLSDISVSRPSERNPGWGIQVPGDSTQTIYVWIDALMNYVTGSDFGIDIPGNAETEWEGFNRRIHVIGKNVWKFHAVYWPALLLAADLPLPEDIFVHGFLTADGMKISKSLGNAVDPIDEHHSISLDVAGDMLRFYLLSLHPYNDGDYSRARMVELYNRRIAGGLGSTATRITAICEQFGPECGIRRTLPEIGDAFHEHMEQYRFDRAIDVLFDILDDINREIADLAPWENRNDRGRIDRHISSWLGRLYAVGFWIRPFTPVCGEKMCELLSREPVRKPGTLFPRIRS